MIYLFYLIIHEVEKRHIQRLWGGGVRNAPVAKCNTGSDHTAAKRPPTALKWLEIKLRPVGEVGRNSERLALDYSEIQHFAFLFSYQLQRHGLVDRKGVSECILRACFCSYDAWGNVFWHQLSPVKVEQGCARNTASLC